VKLRKVQIRHLFELSKGEAPLKTNFSAISPFEADGLADLRDNDLEAIPTDMLRAIDPKASPEICNILRIHKVRDSSEIFAKDTTIFFGPRLVAWRQK
jgi:hypothetical protein